MIRSLLRNPWTERVVNLILVPILVLGSLLLPPLSAGARLFGADQPLITPEGGVIQGPNGVRLSVPAGAVGRRSRMTVDTLTAADVAQAPQTGGRGMLALAGASGAPKLTVDDTEYDALSHLPNGLIAYEPFYRFEARRGLPSEGRVTLPVPYELASVGMADLFGWDGESWRWLPSQVTDDGLFLNADLADVMPVLVIAQRQPEPMHLVLQVEPGDDIGAAAAPKLRDGEVLVTAGGMTLEGDGALVGEPVDVGALGEMPVLLRVSNINGGVVRSDLVDNLIIAPELVERHIGALRAALGPYGGLFLDYRGVDSNLRAEFTAFVSALAEAVHDDGKLLGVHVGAAARSGMGWSGAAYDYRALGAAADLVMLPAPEDPAAYVPGGLLDGLLAWATGEIDRQKLSLSTSALSIDRSPDGQASLSYSDALGKLVSGASGGDDDGLVLPGERMPLGIAESVGVDMQFDADAQRYWFTYVEGGVEHELWLVTAASVGRQLQFVNNYGLTGMAINGALDAHSDPEILSVAQAYGEMRATSEGVSAQLVSASGGVAAPSSARFAYVWTVEDRQGNIVDRQVLPLTDPNWTWTAPNNPGDYIIRAAVSTDGGETDAGAPVELNVQVPTPTFTPTPTNTPTPTSTDTPEPTATPTNTPTPKPRAVVASAPRVGGYFGYGIQAAMVSDGDTQRIMNSVKGMGFNWVKQQVEWFRYHPGPGQYDWGALDRIVDHANANGINVLFSVVKAPGWARPAGDTDEGPPSDPNVYGEFLKAMASRYKGRVKAYEIWNEQNLYYEWGGRGGKLSASRYVELLKVAYAAIKSVDPGAVVISGALTPTGVNDGDIAIDDRAYLEQMYQAGLKNYCDAVGAHPSGYNNPPDADWRNWQDPTAPTFKGHPSFFFRGTMEGYRNIMVKYGDGGKRIWPTEFGWACVEGLGVGPASGYEYAADNSEGEQAQYLVRAYELGRNWGWVGPMFTWNLNFGPVAGKSDEKAAFGIVRDNWSERPAYAALRDMPK